MTPIALTSPATVRDPISVEMWRGERGVVTFPCTGPRGREGEGEGEGGLYVCI